MKRPEYNEIYGYMPKEVIDHLSQEDKTRLFFLCLKRRPTNTGWFIVNAVVKELGEDFLCYVVLNCAEAMIRLDEDITRESLLESVEELLEYFATDTNILYDYVSQYRQDHLGVDEESDPGVLAPTMEQVANAKMRTKDADHPGRTRKRDPVTGKFLKSN